MDADDPNPYADLTQPIKVSIIGNTKVGKSTLLHKILSNEFDESIDNTIGVTNQILNIQYKGKWYTITFFDTAGQETYRSLSTFYLKGSSIVLICFNPLEENWIDSINEWKSIALNVCDAPIIAVATKFDLWADNQELTSTFQTTVQKECEIDDIVYTSSLYCGPAWIQMKTILTNSIMMKYMAPVNPIIVEKKPYNNSFVSFFSNLFSPCSLL